MDLFATEREIDCFSKYFSLLVLIIGNSARDRHEVVFSSKS